MTAGCVSSRTQKVSLFRFLFLILSFLALLTSNPVFYREAFCAQVTLAWDPESESGLAGYKVHYGTVSRSYSFTADAGNQTAAIITGLTAGVTYYFAATAYDTGGSESAPSNEVIYTVPTSCSFSIGPASKSFATAAGTGSVSVATQSGCSWTTASPASWVRITSGASGTGNGTVNYSVDANTGASSRTVGLTIAGAVFTVTQAGVSTYAITASAEGEWVYLTVRICQRRCGSKQEFYHYPVKRVPGRQCYGRWLIGRCSNVLYLQQRDGNPYDQCQL